MPPFAPVPVDVLPPLVRDAAAAGWAGLTVVRTLDARAVPTLVRAGGAAGPGDVAGLLLEPGGDDGDGVPSTLTVHLGRSPEHPSGDHLTLDLRLAGVRALVREMAAAEAVPFVDLGPRGRWMRRTTTCRAIDLGPARDLLTTCVALAGEWAGSDADHGLVATVPRRLASDLRVPQLVPGARFGDAPAMVVLAGSVVRGWAGRPGSCMEHRLREDAHIRDELTLVEVAAGPRPCVTSVRGIAPRRAWGRG